MFQDNLAPTVQQMVSQKGFAQFLGEEGISTLFDHYQHFEMYKRICDEIANEETDQDLADKFRRSGNSFFSLYASILAYREDRKGVAQYSKNDYYNLSVKNWLSQIDDEVVEYFKLNEKILGNIPWEILETPEQEA